MVNRWYKLKNNIVKKRYSLYSLGIGIIFFAFLYAITKIFNTSVCLFKNIFGISCFGCGLTRGFISILELDFRAAISYHILSIPIFVSLFLYAFFIMIDIVFEKDLIGKLSNISSKKYMYVVYATIFIISAILNNKI